MTALESKQQTRRNMMLDLPMHRLIPKMAVPTIVSMLVTTVYNFADTYFVSHLGTTATAAVGVNFSLDNLIMTAGSFLAVGANSFIARLLGAKQDKKAAQVLSTAFFTAFFMGLLAMAAGLLFLEPLVRLLGATDTTVQYSMDYAGFVLLAAPFMASSFVLNHCLRSEGSAAFAMIGIAVGAILNIVLDPIFIFVFDLGVKGASIATAISKIVSFVILLTPYLRRHSLLYLSVRNIRYSREIISEVVKMGLPATLRSTLATLSMIVLNRMAGAYSDSVLAGMSVVNRIIMFPTAAILGFGQGFQPVAGFNWGAKRYDRVYKGFTFASATALIAGAIMGLLLAVFARPLIGLFTKTDAELIAIAVFSIRLQCLVKPIHSWSIVVNMLYSGLGKARGAAILSVTRQGLFLIPMLLILPALFAEWGLAAAQFASDILTMTVVVPLCVTIVKEIRRNMRFAEAENDPPVIESERVVS
ncbi:MAG: MATE family efflux transporter [Saccharofermentanales bacterium]|nr:MATE family efflux transporter [Clostridiaceae bacterium]